MKRRMLSIVLCLCIVMSVFMGSVSASSERFASEAKIDESIENSKQHTIELSEKKNEYSREDLKKGLLEIFFKDPNKYKKQIRNIEYVVDLYIKNGGIAFDEKGEIDTNYKEEIQTKGLTLWIKDDEYWSSINPPHISSDNHYISFSNWISEDNYKSSVPYQVSTTESITTSVSLSCSGNVSPFQEVGITAGINGSVASTVTYSVGMTVPAWTKVCRRSYVKWYHIEYEGCRITEYHNFFNSGDTKTVLELLTYVKEDETEKGGQNWSDTNDTQNPYAPSPSPPSYWF